MFFVKVCAPCFWALCMFPETRMAKQQTVTIVVTFCGIAACSLNVTGQARTGQDRTEQNRNTAIMKANNRGSADEHARHTRETVLLRKKKGGGTENSSVKGFHNGV